MISRRTFLAAVSASPLFAPAVLAGCGSKPAETPLAHLYGREWVAGAYEMHGQAYLGLAKSTEAETAGAYGVLAQKGIAALDGLQTREVPFFIRVDEVGERFSVERKIPERLTFTSEMSADDRAAAQASFDRAREHLHTDYEEIRRLDGSLTRLLGQIQRLRSAIDAGREERFKIVRQLVAMREGSLPFELPYQVTKEDYETVLLLLLERLDDDCARLERAESAIVTVGLTARATDAGSGSLSANLYRVLVAVDEDARASSPRAAQFPAAPDERAKLVQRGRALEASILASPDYAAWERKGRADALEQIGGLLAIVDQVTHLNTSAVYRQVLSIYRGDADYLSYLKTAVSLLPMGDSLGGTLKSAIDTTEQARKIARTVRGARGELGKMTDGRALLNLGTDYARQRIDKQLVLYRDRGELASAEEALGATGLLTRAP